MLLVELALVGLGTLRWTTELVGPVLRNGATDASTVDWAMAWPLVVPAAGLACLWILLVGRLRGSTRPYGALLAWGLPVALFFGAGVAAVLTGFAGWLPLALLVVAGHQFPYLCRRMSLVR